MSVETYVPVPEFYAGKSVFITGGAGYIGKVLLEKLLYSCPKVDKIYLLLRDKKNMTAEQRLQTITDLPIFSRLRNERPQDMEKIVSLKGDISAQNLNMKTEDLETVIEKVSVVIHSAASIKFNEPLKVALKTNLEGTRNVLNLCHLMKNIQVFVHVSTAYCNSERAVIEEIVYPPPVSIEEAYKFVEDNPDEAKVAKFLKGKPNTYTFTKALAEYLVSETHGDIPAVIIRPSIGGHFAVQVKSYRSLSQNKKTCKVKTEEEGYFERSKIEKTPGYSHVTPSKDEPVKGWVDNWFGATGLLTAVGKGICRVMYTADDHILDLIPVDYVCNLTLVAAAKATRLKEVAVYNSCSGSTNPITVREITDLYSRASVKNKFNVLPFPNLICTKRHWLVKMITLMMYLAAYVADLVTQLTGNRPKFTKQITQVAIVQNLLQYFTSNSWVMKTERSQVLYESLSPSDARLYPCLARDIKWREYIPVYFQGVKKYLLEKATV